ncbi:uncharacterized protein LOC133865376 [Alnus glutinosa]|uniref:uncharacterized protein LOC133865376 n=1 Tax=Alnus glutinosa TaxID=3517 RepID=UPI002D78D108|nr:uncharacterized protein LOC133865376 [Alnus glutinosa]
MVHAGRMELQVWLGREVLSSRWLPTLLEGIGQLWSCCPNGAAGVEEAARRVLLPMLSIRCFSSQVLCCSSRVVQVQKRVAAVPLSGRRDVVSSSTRISARQECNSVHGFWRCKHAFPCASLLVSRIAIAQRTFWISPPRALLLVAKFTSVIGT